MATTIEIITVRNPDLAADANVSFYITQATGKISSCFTGDTKNEAIALLAMHMFALDSRGSSGSSVGSVKSEKEGDLSRSFGKSGSFNIPPYYGQTTWGVEYWELINSSFMLPRNRFIDGC